MRWPLAASTALSRADLDLAAQAAVGVLAEALMDEPVMWCDPAMVDLLATASAELPAEAVQGVADEPVALLPPSGMVVFGKDMPAEWTARRIEDGPFGEPVFEQMSERVRAVTWSAFTEGVPVMLVMTWVTGRAGLLSFDCGQLARVGELRPGRVWQFVRLDRDGSERGCLGGLLQALGQLSRQPVVRVEEGPASKAAQRASRAARAGSGMVRRLYLQRPQDGPAELAALRAERSGQVQAHWVRGHWKRQWYPSVEEHRWVWVNGYPRGDGEVTPASSGVLIARGCDRRMALGVDVLDRS